MIQLQKIKLFISVILEKILITSDIMVVSVSRLVVKSRSRSWLCDLSPEPTSVGDGDLRESLLTHKLFFFIHIRICSVCLLDMVLATCE